MEHEYFISLYLDTRRAKKSGNYPLKLRVSTPQPQKQKLFSTKHEFTKKEFKDIWETTRPRAEQKETRLELAAIEAKANEIAKDIKPFDIEKFERRLLRKASDSNNVIFCYNQTIAELTKNQKFGTASNYNLSLKSLVNFIEYKTKKTPQAIPFELITCKWLNQYEKYMIEDLDRSYTTVSMYVRALRTIFNTAIRENEIKKEIYPFGSAIDKYQPPKTRSPKKTLVDVQLKALLNAEPKTEYQSKAKDFWLFAFVSNGLNTKDIALLRNKDLQGDSFTFVRAKTKHVRDGETKVIEVLLNDYSKRIIKKYRNKDRSPNAYLFTILDPQNTAKQNFLNVKNFTRFVNQHLKQLAADNGIPTEVSSGWARHSFASKALKSNLNLKSISDALGHSNTKTTETYLSGFTDDVRRKLADNILNFD
jgi:integrase/recombinase XerD